MSFIVKGIDAPEKFFKDDPETWLVLRFCNDGSVGIFVQGSEECRWLEYEGAKVIQIPKDHGRLIDRDELQKAIKTDIMGGLNYEYFIRNASIILEAEE